MTKIQIREKIMDSNTIQRDITPETMVGTLLENYPELEQKLIELAPVFSKLRNPVLRKTIAKVTSLKQAATVGQLQVSHLITELRKAAGLNSGCCGQMNMESWKLEAGDADYSTPPTEVYDATEDLEKGVHPGGKVVAAVSKLNAGEIYLLITPFTPAPLIDKMKDKGYSVWSRNAGQGRFETYIRK